ncbi:hypothetical protein DV735_g3080, partial [Chaetothyriales sp. CBS 134920]
MRIVLRAKHLSRSQWVQHVRRYSTPVDPSPIRIQSQPAPHSGSIRVLLLDRAETRNALSRRLVADLGRQVDELAAEGGRGGTRALVIASNSDKAFCAGADLKERQGMSQEETLAFLHDLRRVFTNLSQLPIPTISAVSSVALGGGLELSLCTTFRVFGSSVTVGLPETRLAIIPGAGGTYRLPALIGPNRARDLILTGRRVSGPEAYFLGLCDRLVEITPEEEEQPGAAKAKVLEVGLQLARDICEGGPIAIPQALRAVNGWQRGQENENEAYDVVLKTDDRLEALRAFAEKRKPAFRGR